MHYAISDIHGCYDLYRKMLEKIEFSDDDTLIFLGDAADRGPDGIKVMQDLMRRKNVVCLLGNHEDMFRRVAGSIGRKLTLEEKIDVEGTMIGWVEYNGGDVTWEAYKTLSKPEQRELVDWMNGLPHYYELAVNGRAFLLVHAGVGVYEPEKDLSDCTEHDFIWERMDYGQVYYKDKLLVTGHTPTGYIDPAFSGRIMRKNNHVAIDCGAVYTGTLGCICLETLEEFYVNE